MVTIKIPQDTTFSFDVPGRYACNTLDEALDSTNPNLPDQADARPFDHIVIGGGSFGAVLAARLFNLDITHSRRILVIEAGPLALPEHVQNLPPDFSPPGDKTVPGTVWGQPWVSDSPQSFNQGFPGLAFCVGGRSVFWGGWSPYLIDSEVADPSWPAGVKKDLMTPVLPHNNPKESYLDTAARQIGTDTENDFVNGPLHEAMRERLLGGLQARPAGAGDVLTGNRGALNAKQLEAPLAVSSSSPRPGMFSLNKFSGVQLLFRALRVAQGEAEAAAPKGASPEVQNTKKRLMLVDNCYVKRVERSGNRVTRVLVRYQGQDRQIDVPAGGRVFLALGTIENTRQALVAVPEKPLIGRNLMAHLRSNLTFRVPHNSFPKLNPDLEPDPIKKQLLKELQISALFVKGIHTHPKDGSKGHYHIQITASGVGELGVNSEAELFKKIPNIDDLDQFNDLTDKWIVVTLRGIGEMVGVKTLADPQNRVTLGPPDGNGVPRAKVRLETNWSNSSDPRITDPSDQKRTKDNDLWDAMDAGCDELAQIFAGGGTIQYLSRPNQAGEAHWQATPPGKDLRRDNLASTHHESGTLWMGDNQATSVTDETGRIWETENLYAVGPALLPTMGSPNPMLSGVALARRTADKVCASLPAPVTSAEANFTPLFDGTEKTFQRWKMAGPGAFTLRDGLLVAQPGGDHSVFFYAAETFADYVLRLQFRLPGPVDQFGKAVGNSGVFLRFRYPHTKWDDVNQAKKEAAGNPAWVAAVTGFEVQIDEQGKDFYFEKHRTGAVYDIPTGQNGEPKEQDYTAGPVLQPGKWYEYEIEVVGDKYTVRLGEAKDGQPTAFQQITTFTKPAGKYQNRGLAPAPDNSSGYVGVQAHTEKVAFRHIRIQKK